MAPSLDGWERQLAWPHFRGGGHHGAESCVTGCVALCGPVRPPMPGLWGLRSCPVVTEVLGH